MTEPAPLGECETKRAAVASVTCSLVGTPLVYGGAVALVLLAILLLIDSSHYVLLVAAICGAASAGSIVVGLILRDFATRLRADATGKR